MRSRLAGRRAVRADQKQPSAISETLVKTLSLSSILTNCRWGRNVPPRRIAATRYGVRTCFRSENAAKKTAAACSSPCAIAIAVWLWPKVASTMARNAGYPGPRVSSPPSRPVSNDPVRASASPFWR